jgi:nitrite reductase/ring-hydroxylating ferredoxin subunit
MNSGQAEKEAIGPDGKPLSQQPAWRQDFPIDWPQDQYVARRDFTKFLTLTSLAFVVGQFWIGIQNWWRRRLGEYPIVQLCRLEDIPIGSVRTFRYPDENESCILLRSGDGTLLAYDQKCTHLSCAVVPALAAGKLHCPCHHGYFDVATGRPLAGPPRRPLPRILVRVRNGIVEAYGVERSMT